MQYISSHVKSQSRGTSTIRNIKFSFKREYYTYLIHIVCVSVLIAIPAFKDVESASAQGKLRSGIPAATNIPKLTLKPTATQHPTPIIDSPPLLRSMERAGFHSFNNNTSEILSRFPTPRLTQKEMIASFGRTGVNSVIIVRGDTSRKEIALTFDDGPHPQFTLRLLSLLRQLEVHATFFVVGQKVDQAAYILPLILKDGHEIGNHTYHHLNLTKIPNNLIQTEIQLCNDSIRKACGVSALFFRPPGGRHDAEIITTAEAMKMVTVLWTDDPADYRMPGEQVLESRLLRHISNGSVCLLHDGIEQTLDILPDIISHLRREGYRFVTLSEMRQHIKAVPVGQ